MIRQRPLSILVGLATLASASSFSAKAQTPSPTPPDIAMTANDFAIAIQALNIDLTIGRAIQGWKISKEEFSKAVSSDPNGEYYDLAVKAREDVERIETRGLKSSSRADINGFLRVADELLKWRSLPAHFASINTLLHTRDGIDPPPMTPSSVLTGRLLLVGPQSLQQIDPVNGPLNTAIDMAVSAATATTRPASLTEMLSARNAALAAARQLVTDQNSLTEDLRKALIEGVGTVPNLTLEVIRSTRQQQADYQAGVDSAKAALSRPAARGIPVINWGEGTSL